MANASELSNSSPHLPSPGGLLRASGLKLTTLGLILCVSLAGNVLFAWLILKDQHLHRAPYFVLDLCLVDLLHSLACFPFLMLSMCSRVGAWLHGPLICKVLAFLAVLFCFHATFLLFCVPHPVLCLSPAPRCLPGAASRLHYRASPSAHPQHPREPLATETLTAAAGEPWPAGSSLSSCRGGKPVAPCFTPGKVFTATEKGKSGDP